jgi:hypothetical protein
MSVGTGQAKLAREAKALFVSWLQTKESWRDENSRVFEEEVLVPLQLELRKIDQAMTHLDAVLNRVRGDCS